MMTTAEEIQLEIMNNGPVHTGYTIYSDFMSYSSGIYEHLTNSVLGGHAVKVIGWAKDGSGRLYWIA